MKAKILFALAALLMLGSFSLNAQENGNSSNSESTTQLEGDLNHDGEVNAADVVYLVDIIMKKGKHSPIGDLTEKSMKIIKDGYNFYIRSALSETRDIVIVMKKAQPNEGMTFNRFYVGPNTLSDANIVTSTYLIGNIHDMIGAIGIQSFWFLYAGHGWTIPKMTVSSQTLDGSDIGSTWTDGSHRFIIGNVDGNDIYLLPEITKDSETDIYTASWNGAQTYPTNLTHVNGAIHTSDISGTSARFDLKIETVEERKFIADGAEIIDDGTYYCDEFEIKEHILGHNIGKVQSWFPAPQYDGSLIDWDRSLLFKGSSALSVTSNNVINCQYPFILNDYRGCIPMMPLKKGDYHSYSFVPKIRKLTNGHRIDMPFNSDEGTVGSDYVSVIRNTTDLYDVDNQPERCICYLKDNNNDYLVGMAGGGSLLRGISKPENRNIYVPINQSTCTYGGSSTKNKFYPKMLQAAGFESGIMPNTFIKEFCCYYCWFDPNANDGQVYWYKDGDSYIVYAHNQASHDILALNLPEFMKDLEVVETIEKTDGSTLLTTKVIDGRLYVSFDTTDDSANYIVLKIR